MTDNQKIKMAQTWYPPDRWDLCPAPWKKFVRAHKHNSDATPNPGFGHLIDHILETEYGAKITYFPARSQHVRPLRHVIEFSDEGYVLFLLTYL